MSARVLVVDDIAANVRLLEAKLLVEYYEVLTANDGATALEIVAEAMPDIVLLDVMMPGMDGFQVLDRIRQDETLKNVQVIMLTARGQETDVIRGLETGAVDYIVKPFRPAEMLARVKRLLGQS